MPDYSKGKIYKIISDSTDKIYIGSTTKEKLSTRLAEHIWALKSWQNGKRDFVTSFEILKHNDCQIILLESYQCNSKNELETREKYYIKKFKTSCTNKTIPTRTIKEYYKDNKRDINLQHKQFYEKNKQSINLRHKQYAIIHNDKLKSKINCECGLIYSFRHRQRHFRSITHKVYNQQPTTYKEWLICLNNMTLENHNSELLLKYDIFFN